MNTSTNEQTTTPASPIILVSTWGYEQTNVDFYLVLSQTAKTCTLVRIGKQQVAGDSWAGQVVPDPDTIKSAPMRRKLDEWKGKITARIEHRSYATQWDGKPIRFSSYALNVKGEPRLTTVPLEVTTNLPPRCPRNLAPWEVVHAEQNPYRHRRHYQGSAVYCGAFAAQVQLVH